MKPSRTKSHSNTHSHKFSKMIKVWIQIKSFCKLLPDARWTYVVLQLCQCCVAWPQEFLKRSYNCPDTIRPEKLNFVLHRNCCYLRFHPCSNLCALTQSILVVISYSCLCSQPHCQQGYIFTLKEKLNYARTSLGSTQASPPRRS